MIDGRAEQPTWQARVLERLEWRDLLQVAIALHVAAFILITLFISGDFNLDSVHLYMTYGQEVMDGKIPYQDFDIEYPPLAVPLFALPTLVTHDILAYRALFALEMIAFDLIGVVIGLWALRRLAPGIGPWGVLLVQPLLLLAAGKSIVLERFDIAPAVLTLAAIVLFSARRSGWAWLVLGLATVMKIYPVVLAPLFLLFAYRREGIWKQLDNLGIFALGIAVPTLIITRGDLVPMQRFLVYHAARGLEIES
ncbi:MAG: glycosyltransferase 87 family protein, partial [Rudaea sp.]